MTISSSRTAMLEAIRTALAGDPPGAAADHPAAAGPSARDEIAADSAVAEARIALFTARLAAVGGVVHREAGPDVAVNRLRTLLDGAARVGWSDSPDLEPFRDALGVRRGAPPHAREELFALDAGITTAQWGIAETGSLVLRSGAERHRLLSLLPPLHIAILPAGRILDTLGDALLRLRASPAGPDAAVTFITGPSRTADIELTLVVGVHGPQRLHVLLT